MKKTTTMIFALIALASFGLTPEQENEIALLNKIAERRDKKMAEACFMHVSTTTPRAVTSEERKGYCATYAPRAPKKELTEVEKKAKAKEAKKAEWKAKRDKFHKSSGPKAAGKKMQIGDITFVRGKHGLKQIDNN